MVGKPEGASAAAEGAQDPTEDEKPEAAQAWIGNTVDESQFWAGGYWLYKESPAVEIGWSERMNYHYSPTAEPPGQ